jgi:hypothetical protein
MSEERFERIEGQLDQLTQEVREFKVDVSRQFAEVKEDVRQQIAEVKEDVKRQIVEVKEDVKRQIVEVRDDFGRQVRIMYEDLSGQMRVLHEDLVDRIAAIPGHTGPTRGEFDGYKESVDRRLSPLELAVRQHSADIKLLKSSHG